MESAPLSACLDRVWLIEVLHLASEQGPWVDKGATYHGGLRSLAAWLGLPPMRDGFP